MPAEIRPTLCLRFQSFTETRAKHACRRRVRPFRGFPGWNLPFADFQAAGKLERIWILGVKSAVDCCNSQQQTPFSIFSFVAARFMLEK